MKFASGARRVKQVSHGAADNRADNSEHHCPCDGKVHVHERLGDATHEEADKDIPDEMKHIFRCNFCDLEIQPIAIAKSPIESDAKEMTNDKCRITKEARMTND